MIGMKGRRTGWALVLGVLQVGWIAAAAAETVTPEAALDRMIEGNKRFLFVKMSHPSELEARRRAVAKTQQAFAVVLGCSDSRMSPEILFDQRLGEIVAVRVAGNVLEDGSLASIEHAVDSLGVSLILVLGHERCEVVRMAVDKATAKGSLSKVVDLIQPAAESVRGLPGDGLENAVTANVKLVAAQLRKSAIVEQALQQGKLMIAGARYDLDTGIVEVLVRDPVGKPGK